MKDLYDELGEKSIDKRRTFALPIYQSSRGTIVSIQHKFPMSQKEWKELCSIIVTLRSYPS